MKVNFLNIKNINNAKKRRERLKCKLSIIALGSSSILINGVCQRSLQGIQNQKKKSVDLLIIKSSQESQAPPLYLTFTYFQTEIKETTKEQETKQKLKRKLREAQAKSYFPSRIFKNMIEEARLKPRKTNTQTTTPTTFL